MSEFGVKPEITGMFVWSQNDQIPQSPVGIFLKPTQKKHIFLKWIWSLIFEYPSIAFNPIGVLTFPTASWL